MTAWQQRARRRVLIRKSAIRKAAAPYAMVVAGSLGHLRGLSPVECPYPYGTLKHRGWIVGWLMAHDKEQDRE